ncbi:MAG: LPP20 family lipoprotein [Bacteroidetes bacterium]|nr:LPP20 family lipoprotein [Bacteroidota bacterium]
MKNTIYLFAIASLAVFTACGPAKETQMSQRGDSPDWVNKGAGAFDDENMLYGVGSSSVSDRSASRMQSGDRAKAEIASQLAVKIKSLSKNYTTSTSGKKGTTTDVYANVTENIVNRSLVGVSVVDYYYDPDARVMYALAKVDLENIREAIDQQNDLDPDMKADMKSKMQDMFKELESKTK